MLVDLLLFGPDALAKRGKQMTQSSFQGTVSSGAGSSGPISPVFALRYILKNCNITQFEISVYNHLGTRRADEQMEMILERQQKLEKMGKKGKKIVIGTKSNASKI